MKEILLALVLLAYAIPFGIMIAIDFIEVYKRIAEGYQNKLKPVLLVTVNSIFK